MEEDILTSGRAHVQEVENINRDLTEKALRMRCYSYLSKVKEQLLVETIFEIDHGKKILQKKANQLELFKNNLEKMVTQRTKELQEVNRELRKEILERKRIEEDKEKLQEQFLQAQKMESVGRLASGVAHDFNNLLTAILGYSRLALQKLPPNDPLSRDLHHILNAGEKSAALVRQLLIFSRKQTLEMKVINLNDIVENIARLMSRILENQLEMEIDLNSHLPNIMADIGQLEQVVLNLVVNARDAMPGGGRLVMETHVIHIDETYSRMHQSVTPGTYSMLSVSDTGTGMTAEVKSKIFDPFFTTKEKDKGTGLGLSTVHGIVKQHNGHIFVYSEVGKGTTFKIYFPSTVMGQQKVKRKDDATLPGGKETILVVDDEPTIRILVADILKSLGYHVFHARSGKAALEISQQKGHEIQVLLTDVIMPQMNGKELKEKIRLQNPDIKILFMSGYPSTILEEQQIFDDNTCFIPKPFSPSKLAYKLREMLDK